MTIAFRPDTRRREYCRAEGAGVFAAGVPSELGGGGASYSQRTVFFLATSDAEGCPTCNHKGGMSRFARVVAPDELVFPDYSGNGMFLSLGNISVNPNVGLLFIDFENPKRLRVHGTASVSRDDPLTNHTVGAQLIVRIKARAIFPNCLRYIPKMQLTPRNGIDHLIS